MKKSSLRKDNITAAQANKAVRILCDYLDDDGQFVIMADEKVGVYIIPAVMSEACLDPEDKTQIGKVQFQVSDGLPLEVKGRPHRSTSIDTYDLAEAVRIFKIIQEHGWKKGVELL